MLFFRNVIYHFQLFQVDTIKKKSVLLDLTARLTCKNLCDPQWKIAQNWAKPTEEEIKKIAKTNHGWPYFQQVFMVSSLEGLGVGEVMVSKLYLFISKFLCFKKCKSCCKISLHSPSHIVLNPLQTDN